MADDNDTTDTDTAAVGDADPEAAFSSGFAGAEVMSDKSESRGRDKPLIDLTKPPANGKAEPAQDAAKEEAEPPPEVVQITKKQWEEVQAAASRTASYEKQFAKLHGNYGTVRELINNLQAKVTPETPPAARKVEVSKQAYAKMGESYPELAEESREALGMALSELGLGANEVDASKIKAIVAQLRTIDEIEALEDEHPEWRTITGAVNGSNEAPDPENPFRKWLAGKDEAYQTRVNSTTNHAVLSRAIRLFQRETAAPAAPAKQNGAAQRDTARADRIRAAVQPRGDNAGSAVANTAEDAFAAGFGR